MSGPGLRRLLVVLLALGLAGAWFAPYLRPGRALLGVHPGCYAPFRGALAPPLAAAVARSARPLYADKLLQHHPEVMFTLQELRAGRPPTWNPRVLGGLPHLATGVPAAFLPLTWITFLIEPPRAYAVMALLQTALAGLFLAGLLRSFGTGRLAAAVGGILYAGSGWMSVHQEYFQPAAPAAFAPLALWGTHRLLQGQGGVLRLGAGLYCCFTAGFLQIAAFALYSCGLLAAFTLGARLVRKECSPAQAGRTLARFAAAAGLGLLAAAPQILPTLELVASGRATREPLTSIHLAELALPAGAFLGGIFPELLGHPAFESAQQFPRGLFGAWLAGTLAPGSTLNHFERTFYLGPAALLLIAAGLGAGRRGARGFLALLLGAAVLLSVRGPVAAAAGLVPGLDLGDPKRYLVLVSLAGAGLAALGLEALQGPGERARRLLASAGWLLAAPVVLLALLAWWMDAPALQAFLAPRLARQQGVTPDAACAAIGATGFAAHLFLLRRETTLAAALLLTGWGLCARLRARAAGPAPRAARLALAILLVVLVAPLAWVWARTSAPQPTQGLDHPPASVVQLRELAAGSRLLRVAPDPAASVVFPPKLPMLYGLNDAQGYVGLFLRRWRDLFEAVAPGSTHSVGIPPLDAASRLTLPLLRALDVALCLLPAGSGAAAPPGWTPVAMDASAGMEVWRHEQNLGPAFVVPEVRVFERTDELLEHLVSAQFQPGKEALALAGAAFLPAGLQGIPRPVPPGGERLALVGEGQESQVLAVRRTPTDWDLQVSGRGGLLVVSECDYPGWEVRIDGAAHPGWQVDHALRGVLLPPGEHRVRWSFRPRGLRAGLALGLLGWMALAGWSYAGFRHRHGSPSRGV